MYKLLDVSDRRDVETFVRLLEPEAQKIIILEHSYHNVIVVVDDARVHRFPRTQITAMKQRYETEVLRHLRGKLQLPIPEVLSVHDELTYAVVSFLRGGHLSIEQLQVLDARARGEIAAQFAKFIAEMREVLPLGMLRSLRAACGLTDENDEPWTAYIARVLRDTDFPDRPWLQRIAAEYYQKWQDMQARRELPLQAIHDDLHTENILFEDGRITGVLDFGNTTIGTAAQEMRQLYQIGEEMVREVIAAYDQLTGQRVPYDDVETWAIAAELASYCHHLDLGETAHPSFVRTRKNLRRWLPEFRENDPAIQAIIFDCFGVLAADGLRPFRQKYFGNKPQLMDQAVELGRQVDAGKANYDDLLKELAAMAGVPEQETRAQIDLNTSDEKLLAYIGTMLKPHYKLGMLSNAGDDWLSQIFAPEHIALFDEIALSYQTGFVKPDRRAYEHISQQLGVPPSACVFIDDQQQHLAGARAVGMQVVQYKNFDQFQRELYTLLADEHKNV